MLDEGIDYLVLGCTHYPYLIPVLKEILPANIKIIDSGEAVARQTKAILEQYDLRDTSNQKREHQFYTNSDVEILASFLASENNNIDIEYLDF